MSLGAKQEKQNMSQTKIWPLQEFDYLSLATTALDDLWRLVEKERTCLDIDEYALLKVTRINLHAIMKSIYQIDY